MTEHEIARLVDDLARNPMAGDEMAGTAVAVRCASAGAEKVKAVATGPSRFSRARRYRYFC